MTGTQVVATKTHSQTNNGKYYQQQKLNKNNDSIIALNEKVAEPHSLSI